MLGCVVTANSVGAFKLSTAGYELSIDRARFEDIVMSQAPPIEETAEQLEAERIEQPQLKKCRGSNLRGTDDFAKGVGQGIVDHHRRGVALLQHCLSLARQTLAAIALETVRAQK